MLLVLMILGAAVWRDWDLSQQPPAPAVVRIQDTGWHMAQDGYDHRYRINLAYQDMNDTQRDDANRFANGHQSGH